MVEQVLIKNGHAKVAKEYILYREEAAKEERLKVDTLEKLMRISPGKKSGEIFDWSVTHNLHTVNHLNERFPHGEFAHIVHESECLYEDDVEIPQILLLKDLIR